MGVEVGVGVVHCVPETLGDRDCVELAVSEELPELHMVALGHTVWEGVALAVEKELGVKVGRGDTEAVLVVERDGDGVLRTVREPQNEVEGESLESRDEEARALDEVEGVKSLEAVWDTIDVMEGVNAPLGVPPAGGGEADAVTLRDTDGHLDPARDTDRVSVLDAEREAVTARGVGVRRNTLDEVESEIERRGLLETPGLFEGERVLEGEEEKDTSRGVGVGVAVRDDDAEMVWEIVGVDVGKGDGERDVEPLSLKEELSVKESWIVTVEDMEGHPEAEEVGGIFEKEGGGEGDEVAERVRETETHTVGVEVSELDPPTLLLTLTVTATVSLGLEEN